MRSPSFLSRFSSAGRSATPTGQARYAAALSTLRRLTDAGVAVPRSVAQPIIAAQDHADLTDLSPADKQTLRLAVHDLNANVNYWFELRRQYRIYFYIILTVLLILQLFYGATTDVLNNLEKVSAAAHAQQHPVPPKDAATDKGVPDPSQDGDNLDANWTTYLSTGQYLTGIPIKILAYIPLLRTQDPQDLDKDKEKQTVRALIYLRLMASFLGAYILPLLYGMLGAVAYIFRRISDARQGGRAPRGLRDRLDLRIPIGALSGLAAGWLVQPSSSAAATTLSPLALAFVAGYGAELMFAALDRAVAAFSSAPQGAPRGDEETKAPAPTPGGDKGQASDGGAAADADDESKATDDEAPAPSTTSTTAAAKAASDDDADAIMPTSRAEANN